MRIARYLFLMGRCRNRVFLLSKEPVLHESQNVFSRNVHESQNVFGEKAHESQNVGYKNKVIYMGRYSTSPSLRISFVYIRYLFFIREENLWQKASREECAL